MNGWRSFSLIVFSLILLAHSLSAQEEEEVPRSINEATSIGVGRFNLMDAYLSPSSNRRYTGPGLHLMNERMKITRLADYRISRQQILNIELATTENAAASATDLYGLVEYSLGYHYHLPSPLPGLRLLAGGAVRGLAGIIYNTHNGNNPAAAKADIDLSLSAMALYNWNLKGYPLTLRYQFSLPFAGLFFSPHYGQSYYEIFDLGNASGVVRFNSFHNKQAFKNLLTIDFPVGKLTFRAGYLGSAYRTQVHGLRSHIISHSFVIGFVKEFITFSGKRLRTQSQSYRSAYY